MAKDPKKDLQDAETKLNDLLYEYTAKVHRNNAAKAEAQKLTDPDKREKALKHCADIDNSLSKVGEQQVEPLKAEIRDLREEFNSSL